MCPFALAISWYSLYNVYEQKTACGIVAVYIIQNMSVSLCVHGHSPRTALITILKG